MATTNGNGSFTAALSPTADTLSSSAHHHRHHPLSVPISSLSSSIAGPRRPASSSSHISKTYRQASTLFLTRRLPEALSTVLPLITPSPSPSGAAEEDQDQDQDQDPHNAAAAAEPAPVARASRSTRVKVWSLYLTVLNAIVELDADEGKETFGSQEWRAICAKVRDGEVWEEVVRDGYHGVEGAVDSEVVINLATLLLAHARTQTLNQKRLENYLAAASTPNLDAISDRFLPAPSSPTAQQQQQTFRSKPQHNQHQHQPPSGATTPRDLAARVKVLELYTLHVLARNGEWDTARSFIATSPVLDEERREAFLQALQSLREERDESVRQEAEDRARREEQLRRELEEARRVRAENEAEAEAEAREVEENRRRRRIDDEERERRGGGGGGSEIDYGVEEVNPLGGSPSRAGKKAGSVISGRRQQGAAAAAAAAAKRGNTAKRAPVPVSFGARAVVVLTNLRVLVERMSASVRANPALLVRTIAFVAGLVLMFARRGVRERVYRVLGRSWEKVRATAGMGVKVSYI